MILSRVVKRLTRRRYSVAPPSPCLLLTEACLTGMSECLAPEVRKRHEGITYLLGQTDGTTTLAVAAMRPEAETGAGSFFVSAAHLARVVRAAADLRLLVVGQVHTHPGEAFHSEGDVAGARIAYSGYASVVLPEYGRHLPQMTGAVAFLFKSGRGFVALDFPIGVTVVPGRLV